MLSAQREISSPLKQHSAIGLWWKKVTGAYLFLQLSAPSSMLPLSGALSEYLWPSEWSREEISLSELAGSNRLSTRCNMPSGTRDRLVTKAANRMPWRELMAQCQASLSDQIKSPLICQGGSNE